MGLLDIDITSWGPASDIIATLNKIKANFSSIKGIVGSNGAVSIENGGTGATNAATARANLEAAAKGANSDITSLSGLTTALSVAQGGTGATNAATARENLGAAPAGYGLGTASKLLTTGTDLNDVVVNGMFYIIGAANANSLPACYLFVQSYDQNRYIQQTMFDYSSPKIYQRTKNNGAWSAWKQLATTDNPVFTGIVTTAGQIKFPATQNPSSDPNTLDDYEEGTFTPTIIGTTTAGTGTYSSQIGKYVKLGNLCHFELLLVWGAHTGTGAMRISGLPFTSAAGILSPAKISAMGLTYTGELVPLIMANNVTIALFQQSSNMVSTEVSIDTYVNELRISGEYTTA